MRLKNCLGTFGLIQILMFGLIAAQPSRFRSFRQGSRRSWPSSAPRIYQQSPSQRFQGRVPSPRFRTYGERDNNNGFPRLSPRRSSISQPTSFVSPQRARGTRTWQRPSQRQPTTSRHRPIRISSHSQRSVESTRSRETRFESLPSIQRSMFVERRPTAFRLRGTPRPQRFNNPSRGSTDVTSRQRPSIVSSSRSIQGQDRSFVSTRSQPRLIPYSEPLQNYQTIRSDTSKTNIPSQYTVHADTGKQVRKPLTQYRTRIQSQTVRKTVQPAAVPVPKETLVPKAPVRETGTLQQTVPVKHTSQHSLTPQYLPGGKLATSEVTQHHIAPVSQPSVPKIYPSTNLHQPSLPLHHGSSIAGPTLVHPAVKTQPKVHTQVPHTVAAQPQHGTLIAGPQSTLIQVAIKKPTVGHIKVAPAVVQTAEHQSSLVRTVVKSPSIVQAQAPQPIVTQPHLAVAPAHVSLPVAAQPRHAEVPAQASLPLATQPQLAAASAQISLPVATQPQLGAVPAQISLPVATQPQLGAVPAQVSLPVATQPQLAAIPDQLSHPVATQSQYAAVPPQASQPAAMQPQYAAVAQPAQADPTKSLHDELVAALVAVLEGKVSPATASAVAAPVAAMPAHIPAHTQQQAQPAINPYLGQSAQFGFGSNMYMPQYMYGNQQPMYPAHMYPAYMQEMLFGDTQDPPDPTVATPNTTTSAPVVTTTVAAADPVVVTEQVVATTADTVVVEATTPETVVVETTTEVNPTDPITFEPISASTTANTNPTDATPTQTEIPMPYEKTHVKKAPAEPAAKAKIEKLKAIAKAVKGLRGKMTAATKQKLLIGIRQIVASSNVDLTSLKSSLSKHLLDLKTSAPAREYASPDQITDPPSPKTKTTLPPPNTQTGTVTTHPTATTITKSIGQTVDQHKKMKIRSLVDSGSSSGTSTLESILKTIVSQSNGKTLPAELKHVNFTEIARSLTPEGTDLATQLADPNFVKLLKEVVSKLHLIAHAPAGTQQR